MPVNIVARIRQWNADVRQPLRYGLIIENRRMRIALCQHVHCHIQQVIRCLVKDAQANAGVGQARVGDALYKEIRQLIVHGLSRVVTPAHHEADGRALRMTGRVQQAKTVYQLKSTCRRQPSGSDIGAVQLQQVLVGTSQLIIPLEHKGVKMDALERFTKGFSRSRRHFFKNPGDLPKFPGPLRRRIFGHFKGAFGIPFGQFKKCLKLHQAAAIKLVFGNVFRQLQVQALATLPNLRHQAFNSHPDKFFIIHGHVVINAARLRHALLHHRTDFVKALLLGFVQSGKIGAADNQFMIIDDHRAVIQTPGVTCTAAQARGGLADGCKPALAQ